MLNLSLEVTGGGTDTMTKLALVVDDSQVARHVLTKLLASHGIAAESAESAELALDFLKHRRPDVIFMDHMMPGMDGFQALEAIKANPATATIPVMMYTSQAGELYVGQARALGAFGVLPKDLKPVEVDRVLKALHLIPGERTEERASRAASAAEDNRRVAELLEELFNQQRSVLREDIREVYERALASTQQLQALSPAAAARRSLRFSTIAAVVLGAAAAAFAYLYFGTARLLDDVSQRSSELLESTAQFTDASVEALGAQPRAAANAPRVVELLEWALNQDNTYAFGDIALDEQRAEKVSRAIGYAENLGLAGRIVLRVHVGRFCMTFGSGGAAELAPPSIPFTQCEQVGWLPSDALARGRQQTLGFANQVMAAMSGTDVTVETASAGDDEPVVQYPAVTESLSAGEWNRVAALNQRIDYRWLPSQRAATAVR